MFAFYLVKTNQSVIFEDNQRDLESATEKLSEYLERDITSDNLIDIKQKVTTISLVSSRTKMSNLNSVYFFAGSRQIPLL